MTKPNKTVGNFLRRNPRVRDAAGAYAAAKRRSPDLFEIMDKVQSGEMTAEQGVAAVKALQAKVEGR